MAKSKTKRGRKILVLTVIILAIGGLAAAAFLRKREPVITIQVEKVTRRNLTELVVANGRIQPVIQVKISPEVSGEIIALPVKEGQPVKKGDLLVKIKPEQYIAAANSSQANYLGSLAGKTTAEASLAKLEMEYKRNDELYKAKLVSESIYVEAKTGYEIAKAQVETSIQQVAMAKAAWERSKDDLGKTTIVSPLDGTVSRLNSQLGERVVGTAMMAGTEIMTIADLNEMEARVDIGEADVVLIGIGQPAHLEVDAYRDRKFGGLVTEIANSSKASGVAGGGSSQEATKFEVKIRIKEKEAFRPGMSVNAEIETRSRTNVLTVPIASVTTRSPKPPGTDKDGKPRKDGTNASGAQASAAKTTNTATSTNVAGSTNTAGGTNAVAGVKKPGDAPKPIEVVFLKSGDVAKMVPVKRGISDDSYMEITEGLTEGQEVVSGGAKAIRVELEDGKKVKVGLSKAEMPKEVK